MYGQITLTFRYGREDEEVMGLKFCNEAVMSLGQLYPPHERAPIEPTTQLQVSSSRPGASKVLQLFINIDLAQESGSRYDKNTKLSSLPPS